MRSRPTPRYATWFLDQFGTGIETEAAIGDLIEKFPRGRSRSSHFWYWRQALSIVFAQLRRDVWRYKWWWLRGMTIVTLIQTVLQLAAGKFIRECVWSDQLMERHGSTVNLWPLVTFKVGGGAVQQWEAVGATVILNIVILLIIGRIVMMSRRVPPKTMLLSHVTFYAICGTGALGLSLVALWMNRPNSLGFVLINILSVTIGAPLMLLGSYLFRKPSPSEIST